MNEHVYSEYVWMVGIALSLFVNGIQWIHMKQNRKKFLDLVSENYKLWRDNTAMTQTIVKLRELLRENNNAAIHGERVSED